MVNPTIAERQKPGSKPINLGRGGSFCYMGVKQSYIVAYRVRVNEWLFWEWSILRKEESLRLSPFLYNLAKPSVPCDARLRGRLPSTTFLIQYSP